MCWDALLRWNGGSMRHVVRISIAGHKVRQPPSKLRRVLYGRAALFRLFNLFHNRSGGTIFVVRRRDGSRPLPAPSRRALSDADHFAPGAVAAPYVSAHHSAATRPLKPCSVTHQMEHLRLILVGRVTSASGAVSNDTASQGTDGLMPAAALGFSRPWWPQ